MDNRAAKLALARKKLKDHQDKKIFQKDESSPELCIKSETSTSNVRESCIEEYIISPNVEDKPTTLYAEKPASHLNKVDDDQIQSTEEIPPLQITDLNVTEILISNKRNLEIQVLDLQTKLSQLEHNHALVISNFKECNQNVNDLENELRNINSKYLLITQEMSRKDAKINELNSVMATLSEENTNLLEQLEFTKSIVNAKEAENDSLHKQLTNVQHQHDVLHLQLEQLTNGSPVCPPIGKPDDSIKKEAMLQKIASLEQQLHVFQKERDQMTFHYEHYVGEINEQLKSAVQKNEDLRKEVQVLANRENSLIEQISDMEIRIQNYNIDKKKFEMDQNTSNMKVLQDDLKHIQNQLNELQIIHKELQVKYAESEARVQELIEQKEAGCTHDNIAISKLSADMTSDKVAAQRATEQNKKLKQDVQGLEDAFVKMSKDKLELTEKLTAEKYLNRELTIKLAEVEENAKDMSIKLKAKDEEMIRLQSNYREIERQCEQIKEERCHLSPGVQEEVAEVAEEQFDNNNTVSVKSCTDMENQPFIEEIDDKHSLQKADAMSKLQERFLKIMGEVADLSDEKHRLEHIILQLQNETDTICEYVALYQQQRSLLKRRDEERTTQLKLFQQECGKLKCELEELSGILTRFANDKELLAYFQNESRRVDMEKVISLLSNLKNNSLIDPVKKNMEFKNFHPCNCCSGKLIDV